MLRHFKDLKKGQSLKVSGMVAVGKNEEGEPKRPVPDNGETVTVEEAGADFVKVKTSAGKIVTFSHAHGLSKLQEIREPEPVRAVDDAGSEKTE